MKYTVPHEMNVLEALTLMAPTSSKNTLKSWIKEGRILIDGHVGRTHQVKLVQGQEVSIGPRKKFLSEGIEIIYEDSDLVVIDKPSGLLSVSTAFEKGDTALALLKKHYHPRRVFVVHRLDQDTSGVMVFAFNEKTTQGLKSLFAAHDIERSYTALVEGKMESKEGTWDSYLFEDKNYYVHETDEEGGGERAITHYKTIKSTPRVSRLSLVLETGRKNQIRVHCQAAGHSIVGDKKYGAKSNPLKRLGLHATHLAFKHPTTKKMLAFDSPIPQEFFRLLPE